MRLVNKARKGDIIIEISLNNRILAISKSEGYRALYDIIYIDNHYGHRSYTLVFR